MRIRLAQLNDASALARVIVDTGRIAHRGQMPDDLLLSQPLAEAYAESECNWARTLHQIAEADDPQECLYVAEDDVDVDIGVGIGGSDDTDQMVGQVVGLAMGGPAREETQAHRGEVYVLYIATPKQRCGLGRRLVQSVSLHLAQLGMTGLEIACLAANTPARCFYEALGGRVVRERILEQDGILLTEVIYGWDDIRALATL